MGKFIKSKNQTSEDGEKNFNETISNLKDFLQFLEDKNIIN
jgi:hypothetical protein